MLVCDSEGRITAINPSGPRLLGWSKDEFLGQPLSRFLHPDDVDTTRAELENLSGGATTRAFENSYLCKDGSYCLIDWTAVPDHGGSMLWGATSLRCAASYGTGSGYGACRPC